jgi:hypothetical protein
MLWSRVAAQADSPLEHNAHEEQTMSLEEAIGRNTAALIAKTEAHNNLTAVASAAAGGKPGCKTVSKADAASAKAPDLSTLADGVTAAKLKTLAG